MQQLRFEASLRGELIQRSDPRQEEVRKLSNGMIDNRPFLIAWCAGVADVTSTVRWVGRMILSPH